MNAWLNIAGVQRTAETFSRFSHNIGMNIALAVNGQYAAWRGAQSLR